MPHSLRGNSHKHNGALAWHHRTLPTWQTTLLGLELTLLRVLLRYYSGNIDAWVNRSDVTNEVAAGGGYATGGIAQTMTVGAVDTTNNRVPVTPSNIVAGWTAASISAVGAIIYLSTGTAATDKLISFVDFGGTITSTNGNYGITYTTPLYINA
jgi:hypothetical protein